MSSTKEKTWPGKGRGHKQPCRLTLREGVT